jgi:hypothetical protein
MNHRSSLAPGVARGVSKEVLAFYAIDGGPS